MFRREPLRLDQERAALGIAAAVASGLPHLERPVAGQHSEPARHRAFGETRRRVAPPSKIVEGAHQASVMGCQVTRLSPGLQSPLLFSGLLYYSLQTFPFCCHV